MLNISSFTTSDSGFISKKFPHPKKNKDTHDSNNIFFIILCLYQLSKCRSKRDIKSPLEGIFRTPFLFHRGETGDVGNTYSQIQFLNPDLAQIAGIKLVIQHDARDSKRVIPLHEAFGKTIFITHAFRDSQKTNQITRFLPPLGESPAIHVPVGINIFHLIR